MMQDGPCFPGREDLHADLPPLGPFCDGENRGMTSKCPGTSLEPRIVHDTSH